MSTVARALGHVIFSPRSLEYFRRLGIHVVKNDYYSPIPDTYELSRRNGFWDGESELVGINMNIASQLHLLEKVFPLYLAECNFPKHGADLLHEYYASNTTFGVLSAIVLHCMIRHFAPKRIIEIGSGSSTFVSARASLLNQEHGHTTELVVIDPYARDVFRKGFHGLSSLVRERVEDVNLDLFSQLGERDILFVDSSHVVRIGGDINFLYLEVFPRLRKGVIIHIHDIFFPFNQPREWVIDRRRFWTEQYLLQAFLVFNRGFEVLWCESYMRHKAHGNLEPVFGEALQCDTDRGHSRGYSFWMRKVI
ncbi:MAG TPA: class I SAM-dependent methyltransferase [Nitrospiraceae bacterium]|nr:class I SAM-dependent methyltransferase [Nitrospiraceae bacterium]